MGTLGQKMHDREVLEAADSMAKLERVTRQQGEEAKTKLKAVMAYFESVRQQIVADISDDVPVREITLGKTGDGSQDVASTLNIYNWSGSARNNTIEHAGHPYHAVWEHFDKWAKSEDLKVNFVYNHDGGGRESWQRLNVKAVLATAA